MSALSHNGWTRTQIYKGEIRQCRLRQTISIRDQPLDTGNIPQQDQKKNVENNKWHVKIDK